MTIEIEPNTDINTVRLFFIRHGQTEHNLQRIIQGHIDIDLNEKGFQQAKILSKDLSPKIQFDDFISSDLIRCVHTLDEIMVNQNCGFRTTPALRERHMGPSQGMKFQAAMEKFGKEFRNQGETLDEWIPRLKNEVDFIVSNSFKEGFLNVGICSHGGSIGNFFRYLSDQGFSGVDKSTIQSPYNTSVSIIDFYKSGSGKIIMFGNKVHLGDDIQKLESRAL